MLRKGMRFDGVEGTPQKSEEASGETTKTHEEEGAISTSQDRLAVFRWVSF